GQRHRDADGHPGAAHRGAGPHPHPDQAHPATRPGFRHRARRACRRADGRAGQRLPDRPGRSGRRQREVRHPPHRHRHPVRKDASAQPLLGARHGPNALLPVLAGRRPGADPGVAVVRPAIHGRCARQGGTGPDPDPGQRRGRPARAHRDRGGRRQVPAGRRHGAVDEYPRRAGEPARAGGCRGAGLRQPAEGHPPHMSRLVSRAGLTLLPALLALLFASAPAHAQVVGLHAAPAPGGGTTYSVPVQTLLLFSALSFLPAILLLMTSFTRIVIVLALMRQALGLQSTPPNQVIVGMALFLTLFVMGPTLEQIHDEAYKPYTEQKIGFEEAVSIASAPLRGFMLRQTRESDLEMFAAMAAGDTAEDPAPGDEGRAGEDAPLPVAEEVPMRILIPAFVVSELKTA